MFSKRIGVQFGTPVYEALDPLSQAQPAVVMLHNPSPDWVRSVASRLPSTVLVGRVVDHPIERGALSEAAGRDYAERVILPLADRLGRQVAWWVGSNERGGGGSTKAERVSSLAALCDFEAAFAERIQQEGLHALAGGFGTGNPNIVNGTLDMSEWEVFYPAMRIAHGFHWHEYWNPRALSDAWNAYRYRMWYPLLPEDLKRKPALISELGIDGGLCGDGQSGWKRYVSADAYLNLLRAYDAELQKFPQLAATLFIVGGYGWSTFEVRELLPRMASEQNQAPAAGWGNVQPAPPSAPPPPAANGSLDDTARRAARGRLPADNPTAALQKYALAHTLAPARTDEFPFGYQEQHFVGQVWADRVLYAEVGDWGHVVDIPLAAPALTIRYPFNGSWPVTQAFGENAAYYSRFSYDGVALRGHNGIDFGTPTGTPIVACDDGTVIELGMPGNATGYGIYVKLKHPWGESLYGHLMMSQVQMGQTVSRGQQIALSDNTGNSTGPHLHLGIRINPYSRTDGYGGYSDPALYLTQGA